MSDADTERCFQCALAQARLSGLAPADIAFLRAAFERLEAPLNVPAGFSSLTPVASLDDLFDDR